MDTELGQGHRTTTEGKTVFRVGDRGDGTPTTLATVGVLVAAPNGLSETTLLWPTETAKLGPGDDDKANAEGQNRDTSTDDTQQPAGLDAGAPSPSGVQPSGPKATTAPSSDPMDIDGLAGNSTAEELPTSPSPALPVSTNGTAAGSTDSKTTPVGAIAGGVVGGIVGLAVLLALLFLFLRKKRRPQRVGRSLENEPFVVDDRNEHGQETASHKSEVSKGPRTYSTAQIAAIEKTRQASGGGGAILPVVSYKDHEEKDKLGVSGLVSGRPERVPSSRGRADNTVTSMSLTDGYGSDSSMESLDEKPKLDKGKGKAKLPSVCLSVSSREEV